MTIIILEIGADFRNDLCNGMVKYFPDHFEDESKFCKALFIKKYPSSLSDRFINEITSLPVHSITSIDVVPVPKDLTTKVLQKKYLGIESDIIKQQRVRNKNNDFSTEISYAKRTEKKEIEEIMDDVRENDQCLFFVGVTIILMAESKKELESVCETVETIGKRNSCTIDTHYLKQREALNTALPIGVRQVETMRTLLTQSLAVLMPFNVQELNDSTGNYYGINQISKNVNIGNRKKLINGNGFVFGVPGSGKSFAAKREITNAFFVTKDDIIIGDPEGEYYPLVHALGGQVVHISPTSKDYINPMDINMDYSDDDNPLGVKSDFVLSLCELIMGSRDGIEAEEKSVIDRCLPLVYQKYFADPKPENMPVLGDLYDCLRKQKEPQAQRIATALEIYVNGSLKVFNHRTNVELNNRLVCFDIKDLGKQLKKLGMLIVQDQVWNRVTVNRSAHKSTRYYIDEFHLLLKEEQTAAYSVEIWKRFRKWGGIPTGITQNVKDLLASREIENIFENSDFILMLNQASGDRQILAKQLNISTHQLSYVTNSGEGEGLIFYGNTIIPFKDRFDNTLMLYALMSSKPEDVEKREKLGIKGRDDS